jgi:methionyl aminopeptidase
MTGRSGHGMIEAKTPTELAKMRAAGKVAAAVLAGAAAVIAPGVTTRDIEEAARALILEHGAKSAFLGYRGYPSVICVSVNDEVVHGIPGKRRIGIGDVVSLDVGVELGGFVGDTAGTVTVGVTDPRVLALVDNARQALKAGLKMAVAGRRLSDVSHAIESVVLAGGFSVVRDFVGHGIGRKLHEDPQIPNFGPPGKGPVLRRGMTLAIEPMVSMGGAEVDVGADGWTVTTRDGSHAAHMEHTIAVGADRAEILTPSPLVFGA